MRRAFWAAIGVALISMVFAGCNNTAQLIILAGKNGSVDTTANGRYSSGSIITITATADEGYSFVGWSDGNTDNPRTITIGKNDIELYANFADPKTVDLGLTSGTLWAKKNVGANYPWNNGSYFAWGETKPKREYTIYNYAFFDLRNIRYGNINNTITKYCWCDGKNGYKDDIYTLEAIDDAATMNWGPKYRMPTTQDFKELINQCYWVWTNDYDGHGVKGYIVYKAKTDSDKGVEVDKDGIPSSSYSLSDAHIFLPAAGVRQCSELYSDEACYYWSSSVRTNLNFIVSPLDAEFLTGRDCWTNEREWGMPVRPVRRP